MPASFDNSGKPAYMYDSVGDTWYAFGAKIDTASAYEWTNTQLYLNTATFDADVIFKDGFNNFLNPAARDAAITSPVRGTICFVRQDAGGNSINQIQYYSGSAWTANDGDISQITAGTGLSGGGTAGNVTVSIDTAVVATTNNTLTMSGKTLTLPIIDNPRFGYTTTATAAGTTTLTSSSNYLQLFTGTTTQTIVLPVASTMTLGQGFHIENLSTGNLTVNSSGGNLVATVIPGGTMLFTCILTSGTTAASWDADWHGFATITGTGANVLGTAPTISNIVLSGTVNAGGGNGTNGQVLTSTGTGVQWATAATDPTPTVLMLGGM